MPHYEFFCQKCKKFFDKIFVSCGLRRRRGSVPALRQ